MDWVTLIQILGPAVAVYSAIRADLREHKVRISALERASERRQVCGVDHA
jgi:hypothetical protein